MGMFDYISVKDKLPTNDDIDASGIDLYGDFFQTKDLENIMSTYYIEGGILHVEKYRTAEWIDDADRFTGGYIDRKDSYIEPFDYHGKINFYNSIDKDGYDHWIEYDAYFIHGKLEKFELVKYTKTENESRKRRLKEICEEAAHRHNLWYNRYFFHTKVWFTIRKFLCKILMRMQNFLQYLRFNLP